ncbi:hypothetical protein [Escherichia phage P817]|nr:hypothetical protein [Escherichia phage P817]
MNNEEMIKIRIIKSPYQGVDKSKLPVVAMAWKYEEGDEGTIYMVDADFLPALSKKGMAPGDWPFAEDEVELL